MIPKVIHYCWFGGNKKPAFVENCIDSWKFYCNDYEIIEWNENNFDYTENKYCKEAYDEKKWAFVSDYARLQIIKKSGGFYLDTDVKLIKSLNSLRKLNCFFSTDDLAINTGLGFGSVKNHKIFEELIDVYNKISFKIDGKLNLTPCSKYNTDVFKRFGYKHMEKNQIIENVTILSPDYFSPIRGDKSKLEITNNTIGIHLSSRTWDSPMNRLKAKFRLTFGNKLVNYFKRLYK